MFCIIAWFESLEEALKRGNVALTSVRVTLLSFSLKWIFAEVQQSLSASYRTLHDSCPKATLLLNPVWSLRACTPAEIRSVRK